MPSKPDRHRGSHRSRAKPRPDWWKWYYTAAWKRISRMRIEEDGCCQRCGTVLDLVADHIQEHDGNPELFWDYGNTQCLCRACNTAKARERGGGRPGAVGGVERNAAEGGD